MRVLILGSGTSTGVPVIGCDCGVCRSVDPKNKRTRSSILVTFPSGENVLIDTSTDLRAQSLANNVRSIDAVLYTHAHADHLHGIDDLRSFNLIKKGEIPCYGNARTMERIKTLFNYIFSDDRNDGWKPELSANIVEAPFTLFGLSVTPVGVFHGSGVTLGYRIKDLAYLTDCNRIPPQSIELLKGVKLLIIGALRHKPHPSHLSISEAIEASRLIGAERTVFTHLSHNVDYAIDSSSLPPGVEFAFDGMVIEV